MILSLHYPEKVSLQEKARCVAVIDATFAFTNLVSSGVDVFNLNEIKDDYSETTDKWKRADTTILLLYILMALEALTVVLCIVLWIGATKKNHYKCKIYVVITAILLLFLVINTIVRMAKGSALSDAVLSTAFTGASILARIGFMTFIYFFMQKIRNGEEIGISEIVVQEKIRRLSLS